MPHLEQKTPKKAAAFRLAAYHALEEQEQAALFRFAAIQARSDPRWSLLNASQNGLAASSKAAAARAKACGMKKGFPDVSLPVPASGYHGLYVEMKRKDGVPSDVKPEQREWLARLNAQGYRAEVAYGWAHAVEVITDYLG